MTLAERKELIAKITQLSIQIRAVNARIDAMQATAN